MLHYVKEGLVMTPQSWWYGHKAKLAPTLHSLKRDARIDAVPFDFREELETEQPSQEQVSNPAESRCEIES
jgi:hypothetical protein